MNTLLAYWSSEELMTNLLLLLHLLGAATIGLMLGYERTYHGRAAGMRTYALVCVSSTMLTVLNGYPSHWFGGMSNTPAFADPTRVIQGIMTGIGFLGAGVIMKEGLTIRGLSTAASIWTTAAIGVVIGVGFYGAALCATAVTMAAMTGLGRLERMLPHQSVLHLSLAFPCDRVPTADEISARMAHHGFKVIDWSFDYCAPQRRFQYLLVLQACGIVRTHGLVADLTGHADVLEFRLAPTRS